MWTAVRCTKQDVGMGQNPIPLVNPKITGKWMFIPLKMVSIGIDPYPCEFDRADVPGQMRNAIWWGSAEGAGLDGPNFGGGSTAWSLLKSKRCHEIWRCTKHVFNTFSPKQLYPILAWIHFDFPRLIHFVDVISPIGRPLTVEPSQNPAEVQLPHATRGAELAWWRRRPRWGKVGEVPRNGTWHHHIVGCQWDWTPPKWNFNGNWFKFWEWFQWDLQPRSLGSHGI